MVGGGGDVGGDEGARFQKRFARSEVVVVGCLCVLETANRVVNSLAGRFSKSQ